MGFFARLFGAKHAESVVLIDIAADSVAGAYVRYEEGRTPVMLYARRVSLAPRQGTPDGRAMLREFSTLCEALVREGAPALVRTTGDGQVHRILVSMSAPWQRTVLHTEQFEQKIPFTFNKHLIEATLKKVDAPPAGEILSDVSVIGTTLNGYETRNPYGKHAHRASVIMLASFVDERMLRDIRTALRSFYHIRNISFIASNSLRYQAVRFLFPHERDALLLDVASQLTSASVVRGGFMVDMAEVAAPASDSALWPQKVYGVLARLAEKFPLPRTIFLLAQTPDVLSLREAFDSAHLGSLWLSENPPKLIPIFPNHIGEFVHSSADLSPDTDLLFMAFFQEKAIEERHS